MSTLVKYRLNTWDYTFMLWFVSDVMFNHSLIGMLGQLIFVGYTLFKCFIHKEWHSSKMFYFYAAFCCITYGNIALGYSVQPTVSNLMLNVILRNFIFFYALYQYLFKLDFPQFLYIFKKLCLISSLYLLIRTYQLTGTFLMREEGIDQGINANIQSILNGFMVGFMFILKDYKSKRSLFEILFFLLFIILSGTKKSIISIVIIVGCFILLRNPSKILKNTCTLFILAVIGWLILMKIPFVYDMIGNRFESMFAFLEDAETDSSTNTRGKFIELGMIFWSKSPIWGNGLNSFGYLLGDQTTYSHSNYVELLCCTGILGLISFYLIHAYALINSFFKYIHSKKIEILLVFCIIASCLVNEYGIVIYFERMPFIMIVLAYSLLANKRYTVHSI